MSEKVAFVGLGVMGAPMAGHLADKYDVTVYDIDKAKAGSVRKAKAAASVAEAAKNADIVFLSLPGSEIVEEVVLGKDGLQSGHEARQCHY